MAKKIAGLAEPASNCRRHHRAERHGPGDRKIDVTDQDDHHCARGNDTEKRADLQLLQQIFRGQEFAGIECSTKEHQDDAAERDDDANGRVKNEGHGMVPT